VTVPACWLRAPFIKPGTCHLNPSFPLLLGLNQRLRARLQVAKLLRSKGVGGKMRRAGVLLALLLSLSALSATAAEAHKVSTVLQVPSVHGSSRL
jgi:hypothetical protein